MKPISTQQIIKFNALLRNLGMDQDEKRLTIWNFTNHRSDRTNDMHFEEAKQMISHLAQLAGEKPSEAQERSAKRLKEDKMRKKVISIAYQLGWTRPNGKCDYARIDAFIKSHPVSKRPNISALQDYNYEELIKLINQFESILNKHLNQFKTNLNTL